LIIDYCQGRFANRPYNDNGNKTAAWSVLEVRIMNLELIPKKKENRPKFFPRNYLWTLGKGVLY